MALDPGNPSVSATDRIVRIGVSACLLGQEVRYDGNPRLDRYLTDTLGSRCRFVPVCPEVELGLGVPRPTIRIEQHDTRLLLVQPETGVDLTETMHRYAVRRAAELARQDLAGYIFKKNSPSCGVNVPIHSDRGATEQRAMGRFALAITQRMPDLPVIEEAALRDPVLRERWLGRVGLAGVE